MGINSLFKRCFEKLKNISAWQKIITALFCFALSQAIVAGFSVHYVEIRSKYTENYIAYGTRAFLFGALLSVLFFPIAVLLFEFQAKVKISGTNIRSKKIFFLFWTIIFIAWIPYLLTFYPGGVVNDGLEVIKRAMRPGIPTDNHWTFPYVLTIKFFLWFGKLFSDDINEGIFIYVVVESLFVSSVCARLSSEIYSRIGKVYGILSAMVYAICGFFASYGMTLWSDGVFGALLVLLCIFLWNIKDDTSRFDIAKFILLSLFVCQWRNNGVYIYAFVILGMILIMRKKALHMIVCGMMIIMLTLFITGPVYDKLGVYKDSAAESMAIPIQQVAATVNSGYELSESQKEVVYAYVPEELWTEKYSPTLVDDLKYSANQGYMKEHSGDFIKVWMELLPDNFFTYVRAYLMQTVGFWKINSFQGNYWDYWIGVEDNDLGIKAKDLISLRFGRSISEILLWKMRFISSGTTVWLMLFSLCSLLYQGVGKERILVLLPLIGCWITIMLAAPIAFAYRYVFALALAFPIIILIPFKCTEGE